MIDATGRVSEGRLDVIGFKIGKFFHDLFVRQSSAQQGKNVDHADAQAPDAGPAATLVGLGGDTGQKIGHCSSYHANRSHPITPPLRLLLLLTDWSFIVYWTVTALAAAHAVALPTEWLFRDYADPAVVAWNWSFLPLDLAASCSGLLAVRAARAGKAFRGLTIVSLALTSCAGLMAVAYWTVARDFDLAWWGPNLFLLVWPWFFLPRLMNAAG